jgi:UDP-GlcNAc:undecaprenyl-phosphate GlcNAc-1-phosphate transferase
MDGLSAGVAGISAIMLAAALLLGPETGDNDPQLFVAGFLLVLAGSVLGFLWHNHPPARIFMGDAGSYFVGFCIAVATILATFAGQGNESRHSILAPLCVMAVPFYDMLTVIWIRVREGRSPFDADRCHFSHRLVDLGFSQSLAVYTIYLLTIICGIAAMLLQQVKGCSAVMVILLVLSVLLLIGILETTARKKTHSSHDTAKTK